MIVAVDEVEDGNGVVLVGAGGDDGGCDGAIEEGGAGAVAVVDFVAHVEGLGNHVFEVDGAGVGEGVFEDGVEDGFHPFEAAGDFLAVSAVAEDFAKAFVEGAEGAVAVFFVFDNHHGHGGGDNAGHGADCAVLMAGGILDGAGGGEFFRGFDGVGAAFVDEAGEDAAAHGAAHAFPGDGRAGVQNGVFRHAGDDVARGVQADQLRRARQDDFHDFLIGFFNAGGALGEDGFGFGGDIHGRAPIHLNGGGAGLLGGGFEGFNADVDDVERGVKQVVQAHGGSFAFSD